MLDLKVVKNVGINITIQLKEKRKFPTYVIDIVLSHLGQKASVCFGNFRSEIAVS